MKSEDKHICEGENCSSQAAYILENALDEKIAYLCKKCTKYGENDYIHEDDLWCDSDCDSDCGDERGVCSREEIKRYKGNCKFCNASCNNHGLSYYIDSIDVELCSSCYNIEILPYGIIKEEERKEEQERKQKEERDSQRIKFVSTYTELLCDGENKEIIAGDVIVGKKPHRPNLYTIYRIRKQESNRFLLDRLCDKERHAILYVEKEGLRSPWVNEAPYSLWESDDTPYSFWVSNDSLYENYELYNETKCHKGITFPRFLMGRIEKIPICTKCIIRIVG